MVDQSPTCHVLQITEILQSLGRISKAMSRETNFAAREKLVSDDLYRTEYAIHTLVSFNSEPTLPINDDLQSRIRAFCVSAQLYIYLVIRNIPHQSPLIARLVKRLKYTLSTSEADRYGMVPDRHSADILLWTIFIGYCSSIHDAERHWFSMQLKPHINLTEGETMMALDVRLRNILWHDEWCEPNYWELVAGH